MRWSYAAEARDSEARKATRRSRLTEAHLESLAEFAGDVEQATIPIERSRAALLLVAGIDDGMWPSAYPNRLWRWPPNASTSNRRFMRPLEHEVFPNLDGAAACVQAFSTKANPTWPARLRRGGESSPPV